MSKKKNSLLLMFTISILMALLAYCTYNINISSANAPSVEQFDRLLAGESLPVNEISAFSRENANIYAEMWCDKHHIEGEAKKAKMLEILKATHGLKAKIDQPITPDVK